MEGKSVFWNDNIPSSLLGKLMTVFGYPTKVDEFKMVALPLTYLAGTDPQIRNSNLPALVLA